VGHQSFNFFIVNCSKPRHGAIHSGRRRPRVPDLAPSSPICAWSVHLTYIAMAAVTSSSPPHFSSTPSVTESRNSIHDTVPRQPVATGPLLNMNPQASPPIRAYPEPITNDAPMAGSPTYFNPQRPQRQSLSQEDQNLANSLSHDINGQMTVISPQIANGQAQTFGLDAQSGLPQTPQQPQVGSSMAGQHSGADPNQDLSYGVGTDRRKRSKVSRACDECRRKKVSSVTCPLLPSADKPD
jgi:hypothetical protein